MCDTTMLCATVFEPHIRCITNKDINAVNRTWHSVCGTHAWIRQRTGGEWMANACLAQRMRTRTSCCTASDAGSRRWPNNSAANNRAACEYSACEYSARVRIQRLCELIPKEITPDRTPATLRRSCASCRLP